jgi:maleate cis-trans isomerase
MYRKTASVRPVEINGQIVIAPRGHKVEEIAAWFEKSEGAEIVDVRVLGLTDKRDGTQVSTLIEQADFEVEDLPMVI